MDRRGEADSCLAKARERLVAAQAERGEVDLDEVGLHLLEIDRQPGGPERLGEGTCARVIVGEPLDVVLEGEDACGGDDPRLPHRAAEEVLLAPCALDQVARAGEESAERAAEALRETERGGVEAPRDRRRSDAECDRRVEDPRAVQVRGEAELARPRDNVVELVQRPDPPAGVVVRVLERDDRHPLVRALRARRGLGANLVG